jgi:DNA-directed RNA polymerase subunit K/omega
MPPKKSKNKKPKSKEDEDDVPEIDEIDESEKIEDTEFQDEVEEEDEAEEEEEEEEDLQFLDEDNKECTIEKTIEEDNEYYDNDEDVEVQPDTTVEYVKKEERVSAPRLTKYEMVRILGERTKQLTMGAKPLIKNYQGLPYDRIAEEELKLNMIPFKIRRPMPNGKFELWTLDELKKEHLLSLLD